jgi:ABC-type branched-subunit amino acid transport system ATPase component
MLTHISVRNFKKFDEIDFELGSTVVLIGPNNSGKTAALQALALWDIGLKKWSEKRLGKRSPEKRPAVTINRRDLVAIPTPNAILLWKDLHVRNVTRDTRGKPKTENVRIDIIVSGITNDKKWKCGLEFDYANPESFYCRPLTLTRGKSPKRMPVPDEALSVRTAFLPPMSGLAAVEPKWEPGHINVLIGEGQTAQVLRNLCYQISDHSEGGGEWQDLLSKINQLFGVYLNKPNFDSIRGEITMEFKEPSGLKLDLSSSGRGLQQTLLLLAHLYAHPGSVLLLDEPDAHLEILRQQQIYQVITEVAERQGSQLVIASHSEVVLNEAADRDMVIAFVGKPHRIDDRGSQVLKSLKEIGFEQYYLAEQTGWVLYLEGSTDLAILRAFAEILNHEARKHLERPFAHYVLNQPQKTWEHFFGLREAKSDLVGVAIYDRLERAVEEKPYLEQVTWRKRELENYLCSRKVLMTYAKSGTEGGLFGWAEAKEREKAMEASIEEISEALETLGQPNPWSDDIKASDDFLDRLFPKFFSKLGLANQMNKNDYHILARFVPKEELDPEITEKLNRIVSVAQKAKPVN